MVLTLPDNGFRLRFDGLDQRLRLVEVLDFTRTPLTYKDHDIVKLPAAATSDASSKGPTFRQVYSRLFGPSYPGEYIPPADKNSSQYGTYVLSYPGIAFSFPLKHSAWSKESDFVSLLSSSAALPATSMAVFQGSSWQASRNSLYTQPPQYPRSTALQGRNKEAAPDEIDLARIHNAGQIELLRRNSAAFWIKLGETSPQDLVAELGPPDAIYRKNDRRISIHGAMETNTSRTMSPNYRSDQGDSDIPSNDESETDDYSNLKAGSRSVGPECFYNYFHHGFDAFVSYASADSPALQNSHAPEEENNSPPCPQLVVTKLIFHGNIPGSYPFNRHRRSRWIIDTDVTAYGAVTSEMCFDEISSILKKASRGSYLDDADEQNSQRGMVLNRGWGDSPESSVELLGGMEDSFRPSRNRSFTGGEERLGNTELYGFPGLLFEVLKNGAVSCLTIY